MSVKDDLSYRLLLREKCKQAVSSLLNITVMQECNSVALIELYANEENTFYNL